MSYFKRCIYYHWWLVALFYVASSQDPPERLSPYQKYYIHPLNSAVRLSCPYSSNMFFRWEFPDNSPLRQRHDLRSRNITFNANTLDFSGRYKCMAVNGFGKSETEIYLKIIDPSSPTFNQECVTTEGLHRNLIKRTCFLKHMVKSQLEITKKAGENVTFDCQAVASRGRVNYNWLIPNDIARQLLNLREKRNSPQLSFTARPELEGQFTCNVLTDYGTLSRTYSLTITSSNEYKRRFIEGPQYSNVTADYGERVVLRCEANTPSTIRWGKVIHPDSDLASNNEVLRYRDKLVKMKNTDSETKTTSQDLIIDSVSTSDAGEYVCIAIVAKPLSIESMDDHKYVQLIVRPRPTPTPGGQSGWLLGILLPVIILVLIVTVGLVCCAYKRKGSYGHDSIHAGSDSHHSGVTNSHLQPMLSPGYPHCNGTNPQFSHPQPTLVSYNSSKSGGPCPYKPPNYQIDPYPNQHSMQTMHSQAPMFVHPTENNSPNPMYYSEANGGGHFSNGHYTHHYPT